MQRTDGSGIVCDDAKVSEEEEAEDEDERTPPAVQVLEAGMSRSKEFRGRLRVRYQGDDTLCVLKIKVELIGWPHR